MSLPVGRLIPGGVGPFITEQDPERIAVVLKPRDDHSVVPPSSGVYKKPELAATESGQSTGKVTPKAPKEMSAEFGAPWLPERYISSEALTSQPVALTEPASIDLPWTRAQAGTLVLVLYVNAVGLVDKVEVESAANIPEVFRRYLLQRFQKMRFTPGEIDQIPVASRIRIEILIGDDD